ncbi:MAG: 3-isopropylmalate dehydratase small subunit [Myxococcales bacterium]|nr:3-isopropylmalate dehydratase small subunit [Myxococcales bacterium]
MGSDPVVRVSGRGCVLRTHDIDTDRIIPARFMRQVTFEGLEKYLFVDDRAQAKGEHPLDDERFEGASILVVGRNFGCGSSREHAPQSLMRHGFRAFVGESFAEIFLGNCVALGLPCVTLEPADLGTLMDSIDLEPAQEIAVDLERQCVRCRVGTFAAQQAEDARSRLLDGTWDATGVLLEAGDAIESTAAGLPYIEGF